MNRIEFHEAYPDAIVIYDENNMARYALENAYHPNDPKGYSLNIIGRYTTMLYFHRVKAKIKKGDGLFLIHLDFLSESEIVASITTHLNLADNKFEINQSIVDATSFIKLMRALDDYNLIKYEEGKTIDHLLEEIS